jgi:hypothetical protein
MYHFAANINGDMFRYLVAIVCVGVAFVRAQRGEYTGWSKQNGDAGLNMDLAHLN